MSSRQHFMLWHWGVPSALTLISFLTIRLFKWDETLAAQFFDGTNWPYKDNWWLVQVIHNAGHKAALIAFAALFIYWLAGKIKRTPPKGIAYALVAISISIVAINLCKQFLHYPCPWQAANSLGEFIPYQWRPQAAGCFPSGHASSGYAWLCFYYVALLYYPARRFLIIAPAMFVGLVFGIAQQYRGAHFISHDLMCVYLCWMVASVLYFFWPEFRRARTLAGKRSLD
jgi:membrane-associated PAP2 superfamily phosphatase